eukprot:TRINITY_DN13110_c0_g1_i1.p2 TRINITY_DN13110_c0_g1~~TRINITY_DN13110_c0_g1_i1.p2  ORF type:complete len:124 (+),score=7.55 TRINITY_DN13110_c0_g1_i1:1024-1395(+)
MFCLSRVGTLSRRSWAVPTLSRSSVRSISFQGPLQKMKQFGKDYGTKGILIYCTLYVTGMPVWYVAVNLLGLDLMSLFHIIGLKWEVNPDYGRWGSAILINELSEPVRIFLTVFLVMKFFTKK